MSRRSSSLRVLTGSRRAIVTTWGSGEPGRVIVTRSRSWRAMMISPSSVLAVMEEMPLKSSSSTLVTGTSSRSRNHAIMRESEEFLGSPATTSSRRLPARSSGSRVEATMARHRVMRVQARSMSPRTLTGASSRSALAGKSCAGVLVMRVEPRRPKGSCEGISGTVVGHHTTTGASGRRKGTTSVSVCRAASSQGRRTSVSPAPAS